MRDISGWGVRTLLAAIAFVATLWFFGWALSASLPVQRDVILVAVSTLLAVPIVWVARLFLDRRPTVQRAAWLSTAVHALLMALFGFAIIRAFHVGAHWHDVGLPVPRSIATPLFCLAGIFAAFTVVNLAIKGLGAPFAIALSRRLATGWLYARTRNPMVLATFVWLVAAAAWLQSVMFLAWTLLLALPAWIAFLKVYEERELEIRFGDAYRAYKATTPFMLPRFRRRRT